MDREFVPDPVQSRERQGICSYYDKDMDKECPDCGSNLVRFKTNFAAARNYQACMECKEVVKTERATG